MSAAAAPATTLVTPDSEKAHRLRIRIFALCAVLLVVFLISQGFDYYTLPLHLRPDSPRHDALRPSGAIGVKLGMFGAFLFGCIFLYPIRKKWAWLRSKGDSRHWLDFHIVMGLTAPFVIACHASFKFQGFAGLAFWIMTAVAVSGVVGRYLYNQVHRRVNITESSMKESKELQDYLSQLATQFYFKPHDLDPLTRVPTPQQVQHMNALVALADMILLDVARPFHVARLRLRCISHWEAITTLGGLRHSSNAEIELVIALARSQAALAKRIVFLSRAEQMFHAWHVIHRPFSFSFLVLAIIHISVVSMLGFAHF
jgi:hypothetical protein